MNIVLSLGEEEKKLIAKEQQIVDLSSVGIICMPLDTVSRITWQSSKKKLRKCLPLEGKYKSVGLMRQCCTTHLRKRILGIKSKVLEHTLWDRNQSEQQKQAMLSNTKKCNNHKSQSKKLLRIPEAANVFKEIVAYLICVTVLLSVLTLFVVFLKHTLEVGG